MSIMNVLKIISPADFFRPALGNEGGIIYNIFT